MITPKRNTRIFLPHEPFVRIFSNKKEGCTVNTIGKNNKFKMGETVFKTRTSHFTQLSSFGTVTGKCNTLKEIDEAIRYVKRL
jgi:hypothetical protein